MYWRIVMCCGLWCIGVCNGLQCTDPHSTGLKFSITSRRNQTGHWIAQVKLGHESEIKDSGPWEVDVNQTTAKCGDSESVLIVATITAPPYTTSGPPVPGYEFVSSWGYYKFHTDVKTWSEAMKTCTQEGAHLLIINSELEAKALSYFWDKNPRIQGGANNNWAFVGFHDQYKEGEYVTVFNDTLASTGYMKWGPGDPSGSRSQNCGIALRKENMIGDLQCNEKQPFFCERGL